jgi:hypothetical protein
MKNLLINLILLAQFAIISCQSGAPNLPTPQGSKLRVQDEKKTTPNTTQAKTLDATPNRINEQKSSPPQKSYDSIQQIDFKNFSYDWFPAWDEKYKGKGTILLNNGVWRDERSPRLNRAIGFDLNSVQYGDLTGDQREEAIVVLATQTQGNSFPHVIFVYKLINKKPVFLWAYETGDRADEGLRAVKVEDDYLIIDQYTSIFRASDGKISATGACCPKQYNRNYYRWNGKSFMKRKSLLLPNEYGDARILLKNNS